MPIRLLLPGTLGAARRRFRINDTPVALAGRVGTLWQAVQMEADGNVAESWEQAYEARRRGKLSYAEPDLQTGSDAPSVVPSDAGLLAGTSRGDRGVANEQNAHLASGPGLT